MAEIDRHCPERLSSRLRSLLHKQQRPHPEGVARYISQQKFCVHGGKIIFPVETYICRIVDEFAIENCNSPSNYQNGREVVVIVLLKIMNQKCQDLGRQETNCMKEPVCVRHVLLTSNKQSSNAKFNAPDFCNTRQ